MMLARKRTIERQLRERLTLEIKAVARPKSTN
jgi:hypothetical protein